ncbi:MAG: SUMF1/EgtB/PvdO family nonheme iron enzyme [Syntrophales bacterium]|jgi:formylglycine-generating enzyme required for sulfatase activity
MDSLARKCIIGAIIFLVINIQNVLAADEQRLALVIGNAVYSFSPLKNPVNDASDIASSLHRLGFKVTLKKNVNLKEMEDAIQDFGNSLKRGGVGLFYFAGHGLQVNGINYLIPIGAKINKEADAKYEAVDAGRILDEMANAANGFNIVILDACRDNPFGRNFRSMNRGLAIVSSAPKGTYISYSTSPGQVAQDGEERNSPFASALIQYMKEPSLSIEQVFKNVRHRLGQETNGKQVPWELSSLEGDFYFVPSNARRSGQERDRAEIKSGAEPARSTVERSAFAASAFKDPTTGMEFVPVAGGCFQMGDVFGDGLPQEKPVHEVCVGNFYIGKYVVTQGQWKKIMGTNPSHFKNCGDDCPVEMISWTDVQTFVAELNNLSKQKYRLPTEAEWEYAAREGGKMVKWAGTSSENKLSEYAWYEVNAAEKTHPVGQKKPNALGIYDMTGNVWEWTSDLYGESFYQKSTRDNPQGPDEGNERVLRGGCWLDRAADIRTAQRFFFAPKSSFKSIGFRLVREGGGSD